MRIGFGGKINVTSTELWLSQLRLGNAFSRGVNVPATGGNYQKIQLYNPGGSGKQALVRTVVVSTGGASLQYNTYTTALTTDVGVGVNLLVGNANASVVHLRSLDDATLPGSLVGTIGVIASQPFFPMTEWFVELSPGQGIHFNPGAVNMGLMAIFSWLEL
jgi:hypothetical protein